MGRELAEGKVHAMERQAALAKDFARDLRQAFVELEDHSHSLDAENEELQVLPACRTVRLRGRGTFTGLYAGCLA